MELEKAIENIKRAMNEHLAVEECTICFTNDLAIILKELEKQEKMIDLMINVINDSAICDYFIKENCENYLSGLTRTCNICIREYFEKKVEESE